MPTNSNHFEEPNSGNLLPCLPVRGSRGTLPPTTRVRWRSVCECTLASSCSQSSTLACSFGEGVLTCPRKRAPFSPSAVILTLRIDVGGGGAAGGALEGPRLGKRSWRGQYFSELKCRQNLRLSIGLRPSLLAFHTTMSTASVAARNSFDLGAVGRRERTRTTRRLSQFSSAEEDEGDAAVSPSSPLFFFTTFLCLSPRCIFTAEVRIRARRGAQSSNL